jgi:hypothetical protein
MEKRYIATTLARLGQRQGGGGLSASTARPSTRRSSVTTSRGSGAQVAWIGLDRPSLAI